MHLKKTLFQCGSKNTILVVLFVVSLLFMFVEARYFWGYQNTSRILRESLSSVLMALLLFSFLGKRVVAGYLGLIFAVAFVYGIVGRTYGLPDQNAIVAFLYTDSHEAMEYFLRVPPSVYLEYFVFVLLFALTCYLLFKIKLDFLKKPWVKGGLFCLLVMFSSSTVVRYALNGHAVGVRDIRLTEVTLPAYIYDGFAKITENDKERSILNREVSWMLSEKQGGAQCDLCVLVMGESVRSDFMGAYGAPWDNTPWMSSVPGKLFMNAISSANATAPSLSVSLYSYHPDGRSPFGDNVISLAKKAGYFTGWYSNQGRTSEHDSPISQVASYADEAVFIRESLPKSIDGYSDFDLVDFVNRAASRKGKVFLVLHLVGSHPSACSRTNGKYDEFFASKELSCYIKSIRNTDQLLKEISQVLARHASGRSWGLMYTSDHAVNLVEGLEGWAVSHGVGYQDAYKVPLFVTGSEYKKHQIISSQRSARFLTYMIGDWLGVKAVGKNGSVNCDWFSDVDCEDQNKVRMGYGEFIPIESLKSYSLRDFIKEHPEYSVNEINKK